MYKKKGNESKQEEEEMWNKQELTHSFPSLSQSQPLFLLPQGQILNKIRASNEEEKRKNGQQKRGHEERYNMEWIREKQNQEWVKGKREGSMIKRDIRKTESNNIDRQK